MQLLISPERRAKFIQSFHPGTKQGLIRTILVIVVAVVVISVLGFDIRAAMEHPQTQANFSFLGQFIADIWNQYLAQYWEIVWRIAGPGFEAMWNSLENFEWSDFNAQQSDFINNAPTITSE